MSLHKHTVAVAVAVAMLLTTDHAAAAAGNFLLVRGNVQVVNGQGGIRQAAPGSSIDSGETVLTRDGRAQIRFTDSGQVSLQPGTEFKLADYRFREAGSSDERAVFNLARGAIRVITGLVGRRTKADYLVTTPTATIGIRGTEFQATLCAASCKEPDGLYVQTGEGIISVTNGLGEVEVRRGETAFVASPQSSPIKTTSAPPITAVADASAPSAPTGKGEFQPGSIIGVTSDSQTKPITPLSAVGLALTGGGAITANGVSYAEVADTAASAGTNFPSGVVAGAYINDGKVNGFIVSDQGSFVSIYFDNVANAGRSGDLYWGRWTNGNLTVSALLDGSSASETAAVPATASLHYLVGTTVPTIPTVGSASFSFVGGTPSTSATGVVGTGMTSGTVTANFVSNLVNASFVVVHGGSINVNTTMPMLASNRATFSSNNVGGSIGGSTGSVSGFFVGAGAPTGAGLAYSLNGNVTGVGAFRAP